MTEWHHVASEIKVNIDSGNGFTPAWNQYIAWTYAGVLPIVPVTTNFNEI